MERTRRWAGTGAAGALALAIAGLAGGPGALAGAAVAAPAEVIEPEEARERAQQQTTAEALAAYHQARRALNYRDYRRAADLFRVARAGTPGSQLAVDAAYWEAFSLYRLGGADSYRLALEVLEAQRHEASETGRDAEELYLRIRAELAVGGDPAAVAAITRSASYDGSADAGPATISVGGAPIPVSDALGGFPGGAPNCTPTAHTVRIAELNAKRRVRDALVLPELRNVLLMRDECSAPLRRQAVLLAAQTEASGVGSLLVDVARNDPDPAVRSEAVFWLSRVQGEDVARALAELLADARDPGVRERAAFALSRHESPIARTALRAVITDEAADVETRLQAIDWLAADVPARDPAFLADAYVSVRSTRVRARIIDAVGSAREPWAAAWLRARLLDASEAADNRKAALFRFGQTAEGVRELVEVLHALEDRELKEYAVFVIAQRPGWEASRALLDVAGTATDAELRRVAVFWLEQRRDPTARAALAELGSK